MNVSTKSYIDPLIGLYEVEKLPEINLTVDMIPETNKEKKLNLTRERMEACNELVAAFFYVQDKVATDLKQK
ncbi:MAG: hypothetical protein ACYS5F_10945 [Planctomycetota bacterium]|jgi:hypothetical protein